MKAGLKDLIRRIGHNLVHEPLAALPIPHRSSQETQAVLAALWQERIARGGKPPSFAEANFRAYSQTNEDGILLLLQALLGRGDGRIVEIGCGEGRENNSSNLILNHGWSGWLFDGSGDGIAAARKFYGAHPDTQIFPPVCTQAWLTRENINATLKAAGVPEKVDILSLDIDGMDYWLWEAIETTSRIVVLEYNNVLPADRAITVPYSADFQMTVPDFCGASLKALAGLSARKGYRLVGCNRFAYNAFFVRRGEGEQLFPEVSVESCLDHPYPRQARQDRYPKVADLPWVDVGSAASSRRQA